jgi:uncharacterized membrane protein
MERNESTLDRVIRAVLGTGLIALAAWGFDLGSGSVIGIVLAVFGGVLLFTAATGFCLLYRLFGVKTCRSC